ncbi:MAG: hypothetical protein ACYDD7_04650, partial [Acidimicrobiales bacterium]
MRVLLVAVVVVVATAGVVVAFRHDGGSHPAAVAPTVTSTAAPATTTTTTIDPGLLPQTRGRPVGTDPAFRARVDLLWRAITTGRTSLALPAFFPLGAYKQ